MSGASRRGNAWPGWTSLLCAALCAGGANHAAAEPAAAAAAQLPRQPIELPLSPFLGTLRTVMVGVGPGSLPYVFDMGGGLTVVTPEEAKRFGCEPFGMVTGFRFNGDRLDMPRCGPLHIHLGALEVQDEAAVLDVNELIGPGAPRVGGLVALQTLHGRVFTVDFAHNRVIVESAASLAKRIAGMRLMEVRPQMEAGGATLDLFVAVNTPKGKIWLELDSGNVGPVQLAPHALAQLGLTPADLARGKVPLDFAGLGPIAVTASSTPMIYDGLLNAETIAALTLTIDLRSMQMWGSPAAAPQARP